MSSSTALSWCSEQLIAVGNYGSVVESDFYIKLKKLHVEEGTKDRLFADQVTQVCEAHDRVILCVLSKLLRLHEAKDKVEVRTQFNSRLFRMVLIRNRIRNKVEYNQLRFEYNQLRFEIS